MHLFCNAIDSNIQKETNYINKGTGYVVTNYLPMGIKVMEALKVLNVILEAILKSCGLKLRWLAIAKCYDLKDMLEELVLEYTIN